MRVDLPARNSWQEFNEKLRERLSIPSQYKVMAFAGLNHALEEVSRGLQQLFPHKLNAGVVTGATPYFKQVIMALSRESVQIRKLPAGQLDSPGNFAAQLAKGSLFLLTCEDDPLTGEIFDYSVLWKQIGTTKLMRLKVNHNLHLAHGLVLPADDQEGIIFSFSSHLAVAVLGERFQIKSPVAEGMEWSEALLKEVDKEFPGERQEVIQRFEDSGIEGAKPYFKGQKRIYDRAVLYWTDMDGYAFIQMLSRETGVQLVRPGEESPLESTSLCRWGGMKTMDWLKDKGLNEKEIRGLVVIAAEILNDNFINIAKTTRAKIVELQGGGVLG